MGAAIRGAAGAGTVNVYTVPRDHEFRLELLTFALVTDATAGVHKALVTFTDSQIDQVTAELRDLNEGGPSMTLAYTYGIGLNGSACVAVTGWQMTDALPDTLLAPETVITISAVNDSASVIAGDVISGVTLFGDLDDFLARQAVAAGTRPFDVFKIPELIYSPPASGTTFGLLPTDIDVFGPIHPGLLPGLTDGG
jgi:hypothetical protein